LTGDCEDHVSFYGFFGDALYLTTLSITALNINLTAERYHEVFFKSKLPGYTKA